MLVDAHQHFWQLGRSDCCWPTAELAEIYRDFGPEDLAPLLHAQGVEASVLVQSQPVDSDTDYLLGIAERVERVKAVVGWVDLKAMDAPQRIHYLARHPKLRGLRPMLQSLSEDDWINDPSLEPAVNAMKQCGLSFDALVLARHLPYLQEFAARHSTLPIVIDHGAKPPIAEGQTDAWQKALAPLAALPNVHCKLSGLLTEAKPHAREADIYPYVQELVGLFGPERLMWGSDWPVLNLNGRYDQWLKMARSMARRAIVDLNSGMNGGEIDSHLQWVFAGTAGRFYRIY